MNTALEAQHRARNMAEFAALNARLASPEEFGAGLASWKPRASDIVIAPFGKCGTTWLQQTFHTLRTGGDMNFDDISRVVPWIETAAMLGQDLESPQRAEPRGFKSHLPFTMLPKGAKAVVSLRDPKDALVSMYRFMEGWFIEPGVVSIEDFSRERVEKPEDRMSYWSHLLSWWEQRDDPNVLLLSYEYMTDEPEAAIRRLAAFAGLPLDDALLKLTLERTSLAFMLEHKDRFDDFLMRRLSEARCGLPAGSDSAKVRKGGVGGHAKELPPALAAEMDAIWARVVTPKTGFADYAALEAALRARMA